MQQPVIFHPPTEKAPKQAPVPADVPRGRRAQARRQRLVVCTLVLSDALLALIVWNAASVAQGLWGRGPLSEVAAISIAPNVAVWLGLRAILGLYPGYGLGAAEELRRQTYSAAATAGIIAIFAMALHVGDLLSRLLLFAGFAGLALLSPLARHLAKRVLRRMRLWGLPVAVLGADDAGERVIGSLLKEWSLGYMPAAVFDDREVPPGCSIEGVPYAGTFATSGQASREWGVDTAIIAVPGAHAARMQEITDRAAAHFRRLIVIPDLGGMTNSTVIARDLAGTFGVEIRQNLLNPWARRTKRSMDLAGALLGGLLVSPLLLLIALLIRLDSPGPPIFKQLRVGPDGRPFHCWKFRTMRLDAERSLEECLQANPGLRDEWDRDQKLRIDPRVTRAGRLLRAASLDELPQLVNVLRGEMSLVGPRPYLLDQTPRMNGSESLILRTPPGISGLWQVSGRNELTFRQRVEMDVYYVRNWSVWLDLVILARTAGTVLSRHGAH